MNSLIDCPPLPFPTVRFRCICLMNFDTALKSYIKISTNPIIPLDVTTCQQI